MQLWLKDKALPPRYMEKRWLALCQAYANGDGIARDPVEAAYWCARAVVLAQSLRDRQ